MSRNIFVKLIVCSVFVILLSTSFCVSSTYALGNIFSQGKGFLLEGKPVSETINTTELEKTSDYIYNTLLAVGIMVAIIVAMVLGIQFMVASADEKAKVKEALMPFIVGCIVVFGAFTIWEVVINMGNKVERSLKAEDLTQEEKETTEDLTQEEKEAIMNSSGNYIGATDAKTYIDAGGDLKKVDDETIRKWEGQLGRQASKGRLVKYYKLVSEEYDRRGLQ